MSDIIIGIDLGTTNSEVAIVENKQTTVINVTNESKILPSIVSISDNQSLLVGEEAKNQYILNPDNTVLSVKRRMGTSDEISLGDRNYSPQEISAIILKKLHVFSMLLM